MGQFSMRIPGSGGSILSALQHNDDKDKNRTKSKVRAKVEHVFLVLKRQFGFTKVRYRGLAKNANHLFAACALVNVVMVKRQLMYCPQDPSA